MKDYRTSFMREVALLERKEVAVLKVVPLSRVVSDECHRCHKSFIKGGAEGCHCD